eukprot:gb/GEZN01003872.1/.p1 GENE.gb/GEZN01003872.1/~~gb/GEZN01003872.1/.p1  ORF type:complete len:499 (+),score=60.95 gb/GEZN01003872.1/:89-1585(+)
MKGETKSPLGAHEYDDRHAVHLIILTKDQHMIRLGLTDPDRDLVMTHTPFPPMLEVPSLGQALLFVVVIVAFVLSITVFKQEIEDRFGLTSEQIIKYGSIPFVSVLFTYFHIWLALWMTFYPLKFFGCCQIPGTNVGFPLGWQGIIPFKAEVMARKSVQLMTTKLINVQEVFLRLDPEVMAKELSDVVQHSLEEIIDAVAMDHAPAIWESLPQGVKAEIFFAAAQDSPHVVRGLMSEMRENIEEVFDIENMVVTTLTKNKAMLCNMFIGCGYKELCFIRNSGAWMGFLFGVVQMVVWIWYEALWVLPVFGFAVGATTNWVALKLIFSPVNPINCGCCMWQGLFLKRQKEVSAEYARMVSKNILNAQRIIASVLSGPATTKLVQMAQKHTYARIDQFSGSLHILIGNSKLEVIKQQVSDMLLDIMPQYMSRQDLRRLEEYTDTALDMENLLREKMEALRPSEFERMLHPVFEEDEWKLILMGGVLGVVIGVLQAFGINY